MKKEKIKKIFISIGIFLAVSYGGGFIAGVIVGGFGVTIEDIGYNVSSAINLVFLATGIIIAILYYKRKKEKE